MKLLVLSDSHSAMSFMRLCVEAVKPDAMVHLGDYADDGAALGQEFPHIPLYQVPGNCDRYRWDPAAPQVLTPVIGGVKLYLAHGHQHHVKQYREDLIRTARSMGAVAALYGHTHQAELRWLEDGFLVLNPGSCGFYGGSAALLELEQGQIRCARILDQEDLLGGKAGL